MVVSPPQGKKLMYTICLTFLTSNNEAEYKALIVGLMVASDMQASRIKVSTDSQLIANQINGSFETREEGMARYLKKVKELLTRFKSSEIRQIARKGNKIVDALSKLASSSELTGCIIQEVRTKSCLGEATMAEIDTEDLSEWMVEMISYLEKGELPENSMEVKRVKRQAPEYTVLDGVLYRRGRTHPLLRCLTPRETERVLFNIHAGYCGSHIGGKALANKVLRQGYY